MESEEITEFNYWKHWLALSLELKLLTLKSLSAQYDNTSCQGMFFSLVKKDKLTTKWKNETLNYPYKIVHPVSSRVSHF